MYHAVIGAHYGDEGKGLVTDYLASPESLVVRFNGGAQAGHTVVTPIGVRHEFHHVGAGAFRGAKTLLSRHFIVNPTLFLQEYAELVMQTVSPFGMRVDPRARVTTPFDMLINRELERKRTQKHGSCGLGINETVTRCEGFFTLTARDLIQNEHMLRSLVRAIGHDWYLPRAKSLDIPYDVKQIDQFVDLFLRDVEFFRLRTLLQHDTEMIKSHIEVIFEGAQGLLLDEVNGNYPHVTRSRTGLTNITELLSEEGYIDLLRVHYVTRPYVTRHGAGPLPREVSSHPFGWVGSETNQTNEFQGALRYGLLDVKEMCSEIAKDCLRHEVRLPSVPLEPGLAITCCDQITAGDHLNLYSQIVNNRSYPVHLVAHGPTRNHVMVKKEALVCDQ
jgi:adenylosuccinate synthase